jgi:hypothetical protein
VAANVLCVCDHGAPSIEIDAHSRGRAVMRIVAKHEFSPALLYIGCRLLE